MVSAAKTFIQSPKFVGSLTSIAISNVVNNFTATLDKLMSKSKFFRAITLKQYKTPSQRRCDIGSDAAIQRCVSQFKGQFTCDQTYE